MMCNSLSSIAASQKCELAKENQIFKNKPDQSDVCKSKTNADNKTIGKLRRI